MVVNLFAPFIHWIIRKGGKTVVLFLLLLYLIEIWPPIHCPGVTSVFYYTAGAYISLNEDQSKNVFIHWKPAFIITAILLILPLSMYRQTVFYTIARPLWCIVSAATCVYLFSSLINWFPDNEVNHLLEKSTFFVYATHSVVLSNMRQALTFLPFHIGEIIVLLLTAITTLSFCIFAYWLLNKYFPKFSSFLSGR